MTLQALGVDFSESERLRQAVEGVAQLASPRHRYCSDNARQARYVLFEQKAYTARHLDAVSVVTAPLTTDAFEDITRRSFETIGEEVDFSGLPESLRPVAMRLVGEPLALIRLSSRRFEPSVAVVPRAPSERLDVVVR